MFGSRRAAFRSKRRALLKDNFGKPVAAGALNATPATPGPSGNRVATDTESKMAIVPWHSNSAAALATHTSMSATFGAANNRCSYYAGQSWIGFAGADFGAIGLETGRWYLVRMFDSSSRMAYCYIQGGNVGPGEALGSELVPTPTFDSLTGWTAVDACWSASGGVAIGNGGNGQMFKSNSLTLKKLYKRGLEIISLTSGSVNIPYDGYGQTLITKSAVGVHSNYMVPYGGPTLYIYSNAFNGTIDNATCKEVTVPAATCAYAYASVNGTQGWVMDGNFNMNDTAYTYSIFELSGTKLVCAGGKATAAQGEPYDGYPAIARQLGRTLIAKINVADVTKIVEIGFDESNQTGALTANCFRITSDTIVPYNAGVAGPAIAVPSDSTDYLLAIRLRASGAEYYIRGGTWTNWRLLWISSA